MAAMTVPARNKYFCQKKLFEDAETFLRISQHALRTSTLNDTKLTLFHRNFRRNGASQKFKQPRKYYRHGIQSCSSPRLRSRKHQSRLPYEKQCDPTTTASSSGHQSIYFVIGAPGFSILQP